MAIRLTKEIVNSRLENDARGIEMIGDFTSTKIKTAFICIEGHKWLSTPNNILSGKGCPNCTDTRLSKEIINERLADRNAHMVGEYLGVHIKTGFQCIKSHKWKATPNSVLHGTDCPHCARLSPLSKEIINERLMSRGIRMNGEYINTHTNTEFRCEKNHSWIARPNSILSSGNGCPHCANHGFQPSEPSWGYVIQLRDFIKYGVTNNLEQRLASHRKNGDHTLIGSKYFDTGLDALSWEREIKTVFGGKFINKKEFPNGWTETLCVSRLADVLKTLSPKI